MPPYALLGLTLRPKIRPLPSRMPGPFPPDGAVIVSRAPLGRFPDLVCVLRPRCSIMCPPDKDVTGSAIYRCHWVGRAAGGREAPGVAQRPTDARNADGRNRTGCLTERACPARLVEKLSRL